MIKHNGQQFDYIGHFDCTSLKLCYKEGGSLSRVFCISSKEFRKEFPTQASVNVEVAANDTIFTITDDDGRQSVVEIPNSYSHDITSAINSAEQQDLISISSREKKKISNLLGLNKLARDCHV